MLARGIDGVARLLAAEHAAWNARIARLGEDGCPWPAAPPRDVAIAALGPIAARLPRTLELLSTASAAYAAHHATGWHLLYVLPDEHRLFVAGPPNAAPACRANGWTVPSPLRALMAQHDGIGYLRGAGIDPGIQPASLIRIAELSDDDDLLRVTRGVGERGEGGWCFEDEDDTSVVDVEDRFGSRGAPIDFFRFVDLLLTGGDLPCAPSF